MSFIAAAFLYPLLLSILSAGAGLLVERLAGLRLPTLLVPVAGFGALVVVSQFTVLTAAIAPLTPWVLVVMALCGFALGRDAVRERWQRRTLDRLTAPLAGIASYVTVGLPLIAAGRLTFPGYLLDTTAGFHLAAGEWMLHHGAPLPQPYPAYGAMLSAYYGHGYPTGGQVLLAATGWLSGQDLLWLYFPFQAFALALSALALTYLAQRAGLPRWAAAFAGWIASVPALVTAYAQMGSIKEMTALPLLLLMGAVIVLAREHGRAGVRGAIPFAVAGAGAIGAVGPSAVAWVGLFAVTALAWAVPTLRSRLRPYPSDALRGPTARVLAAVGVLVLLVVLLAIPTVTRLASSLQTALSLSGSNAAAANDPGNLLRPLRLVQAFGIWLGESHRVDPRYVNETYALIGFAIVCVALGAFWLVRRRAWSLLAFVLASLIVWAVLDRRGTEWTSAKVMMLTSPVIVLLAMIGGFGNLRTQRLQGILLAGVLGVGVLASDALLYHGTNMAPSRYVELTSIGQRFAGQGPTLLPDFDEYTFYVLRKLNVDSPGFAGDMRRGFVVFGGAPQYAHSYDIDDIEAPFVQQFRLIVVRRSPRWSRPPGNFELAWRGKYYDVWQRVGRAPRLHVPAGTGMQAVGLVSCHQLRSLARDAMVDGGQLRYAWRPANLIGDLATADHSPDAVLGADGDGLPNVSFGGPGGVTTHVRVRTAGRYQLWLGGNVDRPLGVIIDGHEVGAPSAQSGDDANMIDVGSVRLSTGRHTFRLVRSGGSLAPGDDSGAMIDGVYLEAVGVKRETVVTIRPQAWRSLCGRPIDWVEVT